MTDVRLDASDLRLTLSPDVFELGAALASSALAPLMQVGAGHLAWDWDWGSQGSTSGCGRSVMVGGRGFWKRGARSLLQAVC